MAKKLTKVKTLFDLRSRAANDPRYLELAKAAATNLGGVDITSLDAAMRWLNTNAAETDEKGVVAEINFCRDLVDFMPPCGG